MTISFSGLASGMDTASWVTSLTSIKQLAVTKLENKKAIANNQKATLTSVQSNVSSLRSAIEKLTDAKFGGSFDLFAKNITTTSKDSSVTATATTNAARQSLEVVVEQLATKTEAKSKLGAEGYAKGDTKFTSLASGNAKAGTLSIYVDGVKNTVTIEEDDTMDDIMGKISDIDGVTAVLYDSKVTIETTDDQTLSIGSNSDTSNFASVTSLLKEGDDVYGSYSEITRIDTSAKLTNIFGENVKGTFKIGEAEFTIDDKTTLKGLIANINRSEDANVNAYWDAQEGELKITSKVEGALNIDIEKGSSDFTNIMGFTSTDTDGTSVLNESAQKLGQYAKFSINGTKMVSSSNTVTSAASGIEGLTLTLNSVSKKAENGEYETSKIDVKQDTDSLISAVKDFISKFNTTITNIDKETSKDEELYGDTNLRSIRNVLRRNVTSTAKNNDSIFKVLADIGISTGKPTNSVDTSGVNTLIFDEAKFKKALSENPDDLKEVLVGKNGTGGILSELETTVEDALDSKGYFAKKTNSYDKTLSRYDDSIKKEQKKVDAYSAKLTAQFAAMEKMIASMRQNYSSFIDSAS